MDFPCQAKGESMPLSPDGVIVAELGENSLSLEMTFVDPCLSVQAVGPVSVRGYPVSEEGSLLVLPGAAVARLSGAATERSAECWSRHGALSRPARVGPDPLRSACRSAARCGTLSMGRANAL